MRRSPREKIPRHKPWNYSESKPPC